MALSDAGIFSDAEKRQGLYNNTVGVKHTGVEKGINVKSMKYLAQSLQDVNRGDISIAQMERDARSGQPLANALGGDPSGSVATTLNVIKLAIRNQGLDPEKISISDPKVIEAVASVVEVGKTAPVFGDRKDGYQPPAPSKESTKPLSFDEKKNLYGNTFYKKDIGPLDLASLGENGITAKQALADLQSGGPLKGALGDSPAGKQKADKLQGVLEKAVTVKSGNVPLNDPDVVKALEKAFQALPREKTQGLMRGAALETREMPSQAPAVQANPFADILGGVATLIASWAVPQPREQDMNMGATVTPRATQMVAAAQNAGPEGPA